MNWIVKQSPNSNPWFYQISTLFSGNVKSTGILFPNYNMYFEPYYEDTLWDWFHWIDDPVVNPRLNQKWSLKIPLCCDDLKRLQLGGDGTDNVLGETVILDRNYFPEGIIKKIALHYDPTDELGAYIELSGN